MYWLPCLLSLYFRNKYNFSGAVNIGMEGRALVLLLAFSHCSSDAQILGYDQAFMTVENILTCDSG